MQKKDILGLICFVFALVNVFNSDGKFGFTPLNGAEAVGYNFVATLWYVGAIWFIYRMIKQYHNRKTQK